MIHISRIKLMYNISIEARQTQVSGRMSIDCARGRIRDQGCPAWMIRMFKDKVNAARGLIRNSNMYPNYTQNWGWIRPTLHHNYGVCADKVNSIVSRCLSSLTMLAIIAWRQYYTSITTVGSCSTDARWSLRPTMAIAASDSTVY